MTVFEILNWATFLVTVASIIAASTPTPKDDAFVGQLYKIIDLLAINVGYAKDLPNKK